MGETTLTQIGKLNQAAAMHLQVITTTRDPEKRRKAALALEAAEKSRKALIEELLQKDAAALDQQIDVLDQRLR